MTPNRYDAIPLARRLQSMLMEYDFANDPSTGPDAVGAAFESLLRQLLDDGTPKSMAMLALAMRNYDAGLDAQQAYVERNNAVAQARREESKRLEAEALRVTCPHCGETEGQPCRTVPGGLIFQAQDLKLDRTWHAPRLSFARSLTGTVRQ